MGLRDLLRRKDAVGEPPVPDEETYRRINGPEFTFIRSDTHTHDIIHPPDLPEDNRYLAAAKEPRKSRRSLDFLRGGRSRSRSASDVGGSGGGAPQHRVHLGHEPSAGPVSEHVPRDLPDIVLPVDGQDEAQWEKRATMLASQNERATSRPSSSSAKRSRSPSASRVVSSKAIDEDIQEAIRLHEEGDLEQSTKLFGRLADPDGANNPLSQVLYGLALRHGWGCAPDPAIAVRYLSAAASNAAAVEQMALQAGLKKGGAAKGELVLAIFELANCFRHGWGIPKDPVAAKQYYETAANLGDSDAMNETAWCYLEGFGCKKDKYAAARYYRLAEKAGNKTIGNTWIWKDKYGPPQ
ncbi:hypothetical protein B0I35DRAFT_404303 [Stachybotrys elegans]|uniref:HCP-like protein n=1 Tax=Stachybotrys elegans TaxID=80388 RepID=A0A8K0T6J8_9HYPO|nr:hypothetical protein B0I35DRAFT_404303 [Stachybotrys elegans]